MIPTVLDRFGEVSLSSTTYVVTLS